MHSELDSYWRFDINNSVFKLWLLIAPYLLHLSIVQWTWFLRTVWYQNNFYSFNITVYRFVILISCLKAQMFWGLSCLLRKCLFFSIRIKTIHTKGQLQLISKWFLVSSNSSKKQTNKFFLLLWRLVFVCFSEEIEDTKNNFEIVWPLMKN